MTMRKIITMILAISMLASLFSACSRHGIHNDSAIGNTSSFTTENPSLDAEPTQIETDLPSSSTKLTHTDIVTWLNKYADQKGFEHITNITSKPCDSPEETMYSFSFMQDIIYVDIIETQGEAHTIVAYVFPFSLPAVSSMEEALPIAMSLVVIPLNLCEPSLDIETGMEWHRQKILENADTSEKTTLLSDYSGNEWNYSFLANGITVMLSAKKENSSNLSYDNDTSHTDSSSSIQDTTIPIENPTAQPTSVPSTAFRTCPQCGESEPDATFLEGMDICFGCHYHNQVEPMYCSRCGADCRFRGLEDGLCEDCLNQYPSTEPNIPETPPSQVCSHQYMDATCTIPKTCSICGMTEGAAAGHNFSDATCTKPMTCVICGATVGSEMGHSWQEATCTEPATCVACKKESGEPRGHDVFITKCRYCSYTDFSKIAGNYPNAFAYDSKTGESYEVQNVRISSSGVFSFTFKGEDYALVLKQTDRTITTTSMVAFDCYVNGEKEPDASVAVDPERYIPRLTWKYLEGCNLYIFAEK